MIYIASDHGGFNLKQEITTYLSQLNLEYRDEGPYEYNATDNFPDFIVPLIKKILINSENKGIIICKNGIGVSIIANRFKGIRCGLSFTAEHAQSGRTDDDTNVLALPAEYIGTDTALHIVKTWLNTEFTKEERFIKRLNEIEKYGNTSNS